MEITKVTDTRTVAVFLALMQAGPVAFTYKKIDGTTRKAYGTLCPDLIPPKGVELFPTMAKWFEKMNANKACRTLTMDDTQVSIMDEAEALAASLNSKSRPSSPPAEGTYKYWDFGAKGFRIFTLNSVTEFL